MFSSSASVFAVNHQARSICSQRGSSERHRFLVGTCSLHEHNELSVLEYHEDSNAIDCPVVYSHPDQIWNIDSSSRNVSLAVTSWQNSAGKFGSTVWKLSQETEDAELNNNNYAGDRLPLDKIGDMVLLDSTVAGNVKWHPTEEDIAISDKESLCVWSLNESSVVKSSHIRVQDSTSASSSRATFAAGALAWNPHSAKSCATGFGGTLSLIDTRSERVVDSVPSAHRGCIRDIDYNPNKPLTLVTAGDDRKVQFWDVRNLRTPMKTLCGHSHWVWRVKYNPFHDQLLISGSTDHTVSLWRIASCSSAPWLGSEASGGDGDEYSDPDSYLATSGLDNDPPDVKVRHMDQHEESVYGVAWSPADAWIYCSLSFDGRVILNHVPSTEKYKILL